MTKPIIFFSHASQDKEILQELKRLFVEKTGGSIEVFLSSDGQSIPLGRNWVHRIEEALEQAAIMLIFISPNSLRSNWIFFEAGYAYAKKIRVVPIGILGLDLTVLPPPISLLQGFNITSEEGLNNLFALANEVFEHKHNASFTESEYANLFESGECSSTNILGKYAAFIDEILIRGIENKTGWEPTEVFKRIEAVLTEEGVEHNSSKSLLNFYGVTINMPTRRAVNIGLDPRVAPTAFPIIEKLVRVLREECMQHLCVDLIFAPNVSCFTEYHKITARLYGTEVRFGEFPNLIFEDLEFRFSFRYSSKERRISSIETIIHAVSLPSEQIRSLLDLLFERGILYISPSQVDY